MEKSNEASSSKMNVPEGAGVQADVPQQQSNAEPEQSLTESIALQSTSKKWLVPCLVGLVIIALGVAGYFAYQNFQLKMEQPGLGQTVPTPTTSTLTTTPDTTSDWETYSNTSAGFSIKHPAGWRKVETGNWTGFGPQEIGEDVLWGVSFYNKSEKTIAQIKDDVGKQFNDRKQTEETITLDGLTATKVVTTTNQFADWYSVVIIIDNGNMLYSIGNGAQTDTALNEMLTKRTSKDYNLTFEDYYSSFKLL